MFIDVIFQFIIPVIFFIATKEFAFEWSKTISLNLDLLDFVMALLMISKVAWNCKLFITLTTFVGFFLVVDPHVDFEARL